MRVAAPPTRDESASLEACLERLEGRRLALAVSGGPDSMALLWLVARWLDPAPPPVPTAPGAVPPTTPKPMPGPESAARLVSASKTLPDWVAAYPIPPPVVVVTVDHGLRAESAAEAEIVAREALRLGLPHQTLVWSGPKPETGLAAAARTARYRLIDDLMETEAALYPGQPKRALVTAHHLEDQAETVLMRLQRGSGVDGLGAMSPRSVWRSPEAAETADGADAMGRLRGLELLRPLLGVPQSLLRRVVDANGVPYVLDPTNEDPTYERVRVRRALAVLGDLGVSAAALATSARRIRRARAALAAPFVAVLGQVEWGNGIEASIGDLASLPEEIALRLLAEVMVRIGGQEAPPSLAQLETLLADLEAARRALAPATATLGGCAIRYRPVGPAGGQTTVIREAGRFAPCPLALDPGRRAIWDRRYVVTVAPDAPGPVEVRPLGRDRFMALKALVPDLGLWPALGHSAETQPAIFRGQDLLAVPAYHHLPATFDWLAARLGPDWELRTGLVRRLYIAKFISPHAGFNVARGSWWPEP